MVPRPIPAKSEATMRWHDDYLLGFAAMDATHREFVECVAALQSASDAELAARLAEFAQHAQGHFGQEEQWMRATHFPAAQCHAEEHAAVLSSVREVQALLQRGAAPQVARDLAQALVDWFPGHADYMDAALSHWMNKRAHGGAPVVLKRRAAQPPSEPSHETRPSR